jgi:undecaprenyl pyrophosphate phosphatase UppP
MSRFEAWLAHVATILVGGTGLVYAWMRYLLPPVDPYAVVNHPLEPAVQHLHVLAAPLLVFVAGQIWYRHAWMHWRRGVRQRRRSGIGLALTLVPMVVSGYLIQTTVDDPWRTAWIAVHLTASAVWLLGYITHLASKRAETSSAPTHNKDLRWGKLQVGEGDLPGR